MNVPAEKQPTVSDTSDPDSTQPSESTSRGPKITTRRLAIGAGAVVGLFLIAGGIFWTMRSPPSSDAEPETVIDAASQFANQIEQVLNGEATRLYFADIEINDEIIAALPLETLQAASAKASNQAQARDAARSQRRAEQAALASDDDDDYGIGNDRAQPTDEPENPAGAASELADEQRNVLAKLDTVLVDQGVITDEGLAVIARLPDLEHLRLRLSPISDDGIVALANCKHLWLVNLPHSRLTAKGIRSFNTIAKLKQLRLGSPNLNNECCRALAELSTLRSLHLIGVPVTDEGLKILATLPRLESLYLDDSAVTDTGWTWLFENHPHLHVHVNQQHHDRDPKAHKHQN